MCTRDEALDRGLTGWVRNRPTGDVEVTAEGDESEVLALRDWCRHGPSYARVLEFKDNYEDATGDFDTFTIRY